MSTETDEFVGFGMFVGIIIGIVLAFGFVGLSHDFMTSKREKEAAAVGYGEFYIRDGIKEFRWKEKP